MPTLRLGACNFWIGGHTPGIRKRPGLSAESTIEFPQRCLAHYQVLVDGEPRRARGAASIRDDCNAAGARAAGHVCGNLGIGFDREAGRGDFVKGHLPGLQQAGSRDRHIGSYRTARWGEASNCRQHAELLRAEK